MNRQINLPVSTSTATTQPPQQQQQQQQQLINQLQLCLMHQLLVKVICLARKIPRHLHCASSELVQMW